MKHLLLITLATASVTGCARHSNSSATEPGRVPPARVRIATVHAGDVAEINEITGIIRPIQRAQLAAKVMGPIEDLPVTLGQHVRSGEVLVTINAGEISARVVQAQSQLNAARRDLERERDLLTKGASTADMVRGLEDRFTAAQAMVREAEAMLGYTAVRAPFDGVISRKLANTGDLAAPGYPLLEIEGTRDFQVEAGIPDSLAGRLTSGIELVVTVPSAGASFQGKLAELSPAADPGSHTVLAKIAVPADAHVRSGEYARVQVPGPVVTSVLVPASAVSRSGQMERVFVAGAPATGAARPHAVLRLVKTGASRNAETEILAGIDPGERVVVNPPAGLVEGQPLEAVE